MKSRQSLFFWFGVWVFLILLFSTSLSLIVAFYFVTFLMPIVIGTSLFFNRYLVPTYLIQNRRLKFALYFIYMTIISVYLELLVMVLAFVILADYKIQNLGKIASDIYLLTLILYLIVIVEGLILTLQKLKENLSRVKEVEEQLALEKISEIIIRVNRKSVPIRLDEIQYIESLGDYVQVHTQNGLYTTKEKISSFAKRLPNSFIRIHRSFLINRINIDSFNKEVVRLGDKELPIGRKYKMSFEQFIKA